MKIDFEGRTAVVTGGAKGIGQGCARRLAELGARVVVADIDREAGEATASEIGGEFAFLDVGSVESVDSATAMLWDKTPVDIVVTSAGILQPPLPPDELPIETWDRVMAIDQRGTYLTCRSFGSRMAKRGRGSIVTIASIVGTLAAPLHSYSPAKAAVIMMTQVLATEWGRAGVRVNAVSPGLTLTAALADAVSRGERDVSRIAASNPMNRALDPLEVANAVAFLASDYASGINGVNLPVDCGWIAAGTWRSYGIERAGPRI